MTNTFLKLALFICLTAFFNCSTDDGPSGPIDITIEGAAIAPEVGGPNQPNQVYVDLSTNTTTAVQRDSWDLGFYSGSEFRVVINGSIAMATSELSTIDIDAVRSNDHEVQSLQPQVAVGTFDSNNVNFVDAFNGSINGTAISAISSTDSENKVYLVNLGNSVGTETPATGGVNLNGEARGWKKIRVLQDNSNYILQYADLDAATHETVSIPKNPEYRFTYFSFNTESIVTVAPQTENWDLNFTAFTDEVFAGPESFGAYFYGDFVVSNSTSNVRIYGIDSEENPELNYDNFTLENIDQSSFSSDQRAIGSSWRNGGGPGSLPSLKDQMFYIVNDANGNFYKLKFIALTSETGERGNPEFVYSLLQ